MSLVEKIQFAVAAATTVLVALVNLERIALSAVRVGNKLFEEVSGLIKKNLTLPTKEEIMA